MLSLITISFILIPGSCSESPPRRLRVCLAVVRAQRASSSVSAGPGVKRKRHSGACTRSSGTYLEKPLALLLARVPLSKATSLPTRQQQRPPHSLVTTELPAAVSGLLGVPGAFSSRGHSEPSTCRLACQEPYKLGATRDELIISQRRSARWGPEDISSCLLSDSSPGAGAEGSLPVH